MAGFNTSGLGGSGLDVNSLVSQLVAAERAPLQQRFSRVESQINTQLTALGTIRSGLSTLQSSLSAIKTVDSLNGKRTVSSDPAVFKATASASASPASYAIEVKKLATSDKRSSAAMAGGESATVGNGTLTLTQNGVSFNVTTTPSTTLAQLRDAINSALDNTGVRAALLNTAAGTRLTLTSNQTGVAQAISLSATGGLNSFINGFSVTTPAQDAEVLIDGFQVLSPTNTVTSAVSGVSLELVSAKPGTSLNLTISQDVQANKDKINKLVTDFNAFQSQALRLRAFDSKTRTGGPLIGDSALRNIENSIRRELTGTTASAPANTNSLSSIGIRFGADGRLTVNDSVLTEALTQRPDQVVQMLTATDGLVARVSAVVDAQVSTDGLLTARTNSLDARKRALGKDKEAMETRMLLVEKRYRAQFIGLDRMLTEMQGTSSYIAKIGSGT